MQLSKLCLATKKFLSAMVITTTVLSTTPIQKINLKGSEINVSAATETKISNPRIVKDDDMDSGQKVTWDCIYFGSYPQTEIVDKAQTSGTYGRDWEEKGDYEINPKIYKKLQNATDWDDNEDITIDGIKYRRLKMEDTLYYKSNTIQYFSNLFLYNWKEVLKSYHYFRYDKIKWRILNVKNNTAFLLSDKALDCQKYNTKDERISWKRCTLRSWLNGYEEKENESKDNYSNKNFIRSAFNENEINKIIKTKLSKNDNLYGETNKENDTIDRIFLLSETETYTDIAKNYGFINDDQNDIQTKDNARRCKTTTYAKAMGSLADDHSNYLGKCWWLLRSPGFSDDGGAVEINADGTVNPYGDYGYYEAIRPALKLDLSSTNSWSYAGTVNSSETQDEIDKPDHTGDKTEIDDDKTEIKQPEYKDVEDVEDDDMEGSETSTQLLGNISGKSKAPITEFIPGDYSLKMPFVNINKKKTSNEDGGYTYRISIGTNKNILFNQEKDSEKKWSKYKEDIDKALKNKKKLNNMKNLMKFYGVKSANFEITKSFVEKPEIDIIGYYEEKCNEKGEIMSESGNIALKFTWKGSRTKQCITAPIPIPYYIENDVTLDTEGGFGLELKKNNIIADNKSDLKIIPDFGIGAGVGISGLLTVGVKGSAGGYFQLLPWTVGRITGGVSVKAKVLFLYDKEYKLAKATIPLWNTTEKSKKTQLKSVADKSINKNDSLTLTNRQYQNKTSAWDGNISVKNNKLRQASSDSTITTKELQSYILPNSIPKMIKQEDDTIMVFQSNDASRSTQNSVKLMYSIYHNGKWSEPKAFLDNGTLDTFADLKKIGNDIFVTWQKCDKKIADSADIDKQTENIAKDSEIYISKYDANTKSFGKVEKISDNDTLDMMPKLIDKNGTPAVMWVNVPSNDIVTLKGKKTIKVSEYDNNKWQQATDIGNTDTYISELTGTYAENKYHAIYIGTDNDQNTKFYDLDTGKENVVYDNAADLSNIHVTKDIITYVQDGTLKSYNLSTKITKDISDSNKTAISANAIQESNGDKTAILWMENDDSGCKFYSSVKTKDGYSAPVNIYTQQGVNGNYFTATLDDNGEWDIILNAQDSDDDEKTSMFYIHKKSAPKIAIEDMSIDGNDMENGEQPVLYTVTNQSEETIKSFNLKISNDDGEIVNKTVSCNLLPGESKLFEDKFSFDNITRIENFTVETVADGQKDTSQSQLKEEVSYTDLGITDVKKTITKDGVQYTATVTNNGQVAASGIIDFYKDNKLSDKLTTKAVSTIQAGESKKVTFNYKTSDMKFDEDQNTYCSMKLSSDDEKDSNSQNDSYYGVIYRWELPGQNDISDCTVKLSSEQFTEDGLAKEPDITVKRGNLLLEKGTDYQVEYHNNVKAGMAVVAITGINRYVGRIERSYVINVAQKDHNQNNNSTEDKPDKSNLTKPIVKVDKITINGISKQLAAGKSIKLTANILPKNAKTKSVAWKTSNKKVATVNKNGVVKINKRAAGKTVTITAIAKDGSNKKATYKIKVMKGSVKSISIKGKKTVKAGKTLKLTAKVKASKGANKKLIWKSSNTKYATVSSSGKVKTKKTGKKKTVKITVMSTDGTNKKKTVKIKIK